MTRFKIMSFDFGYAYPRTSDPIEVSVFEIKSYVEDYMRTYNMDYLKLFMSQRETIPYEYQFDCYLEAGKFWTTRHLNQEGCFLHE